MQDELPYFVEVRENGCSKCGAYRIWGIFGPGGMVEISLQHEEEAAHLADILNEAFEFGSRAGVLNDKA